MISNKTNDYRRAFGVLIPLCLLSLLIACLVISVANDMYAFVKPDVEITVNIPSPMSDKQLSRLLQQNGVINNAAVFSLYLRSKGASEKLGNLSGEIKLNSNMSYREILLEIL